MPEVGVNKNYCEGKKDLGEAKINNNNEEYYDEEYDEDEFDTIQK